MMKICRLALENSLSGLEFAYGIPGTAGGAVYMNAGAYGGEMKDVLVKCEHLDSELNEGSFSGEDLQLGYRHSIYSENDYVITSLTLKMKKGNYDDIKALMDENLSKRKAKQPLDFPSAGSTFKRPDGYFAGALIEQCNLKGYCIGDAQVSEKHAGFVINKGNATTSDILKLIKHIQKTVFENKGVMLETEVKYFE
jgi:UDP-N-acetylmuramate dehydrogenase